MATPVPIAPGGPACRSCGAPAVVHWQRRLTEAEIAAEQKIEQDRRNETALLADSQLPAPVFPPMPDFLDATTVVFGCAQHAISIDAATRIHQAACTGCDCTPEPAPPPDPEPETPALPPGW